MTPQTKQFVLDKMLQNLLFSGFIFMLWSKFIPWKLYFLLGLIVAVLFIFNQLKLVANKKMYGIIFVADLVFWPTMIANSIQSSFNK